MKPGLSPSTPHPPCRAPSPRSRGEGWGEGLPGRILATLCAAILAGCAVTQPVTPKYDLPPGTATAAQNELLERWWTAFSDPVLNALVEEAFAHNLDLKAALARIEAARAQVLLAQSYLYPSIDLAGNANRSRISANTSPPLQAGTAQTSNNFNLALQVSYELDVWGKYRAGLLASNNELVASQYFRETVRITVAADVANAYFRLRAADAELAVLKDTLRLRTETVRLQRDRFEGGIIGEYDLRTAEAERSAVVADVARAERAIAQLESAIATLTGRSPRQVFTPEVARGNSIEDATQVPLLPSGLPSGLLERRPDIRRVEALLAASDLRIQEARANYFPQLTLTGAYGFESAALSSLFSPGAVIWNLGFGLLQPLLALKAIEAQVELAQARRNDTEVQYAQIVQNAFREVHDALAANRTARDVLAAETDRRNEIAKAYEVAQLRYDAGRTSFLEVIDAQRQLLAAETLRIDAARDAKLSIVDFAKSLGGGWNPEKFEVSRR
ncbi:MAG: efflux transporter outer membrane subunit [Burkholderiales bacterium]|nr:efflux transporter outer membrane subunit [Burkholderiales bacterium]